jgi:hypothetical protein
MAYRELCTVMQKAATYGFLRNTIINLNIKIKRQIYKMKNSELNTRTNFIMLMLMYTKNQNRFQNK